MRRLGLGAVVLVTGMLAVAAAGAEPRAGSPTPPSGTIPHPGASRPGPDESAPAKPHRPGELECRNCHQAKHQGVIRMYLGVGGRGTPMIPSHMFQVRVECVACHVVPKEGEATAGLIGQTFRPSEQACVGCHGEKYRGMLDRWSMTLVRMREMLAPKLEAARAALATPDPKHPRPARPRTLVDDADFNVRFVALGRGVHNVFYAADLLTLANGWLDEALASLGKTPPAIDDALVRGGYCAVLCHEQAGVKQREVVTFQKQKVPHIRHVTEFGAVCTACHSAEVHRAVTATPRTCSSCHHSARNERCESCHRAQSTFYRGRVTTALTKVEPNVMATAVGCTGCHDLGKKHSRKAVGEKCVACHDSAYTNFLTEWTSGLDREAARAAEPLRRAEAALARARRAGQKPVEAEALVRDARKALALVRKARGVHNPGVAEGLLGAAREKAEQALATTTGKREVHR